MTDSSAVTVFPPSGSTGLREMVRGVFERTDLRPSTRKTYEFAVKDFLKWAEGRSLDQTLLVSYKNDLRARTNLSPKTANLYLAAARTVFRQLFTLGVLPFDASKLVRSFDIGPGHKRSPITDVQVKRAFAYAAKKADARLVLILNLLYRQGLRQKEVVDLRVEHFDDASGTLAILGKGRDDRELIHLHPETTRALLNYLDERGIGTGYVFPSRKAVGSHIGVAALYRIVRELHIACRIPNSPHAWRKVFTSKLIESGMNLLDVQSFTRHRGLGQLRVYFDRISFAKSLPAYYAVFAEGETG
jgi:integrase/recombinase XerC